MKVAFLSIIALALMAPFAAGQWPGATAGKYPATPPPLGGVITAGNNPAAPLPPGGVVTPDNFKDGVLQPEVQTAKTVQEEYKGPLGR